MSNTTEKYENSACYICNERRTCCLFQNSSYLPIECERHPRELAIVVETEPIMDTIDVCKYKASCPMYCFSVCEYGKCFFDKSGNKEVIL